MLKFYSKSHWFLQHHTSEFRHFDHHILHFVRKISLTHVAPAWHDWPSPPPSENTHVVRSERHGLAGKPCFVAGCARKIRWRRRRSSVPRDSPRRCGGLGGCRVPPTRRHMTDGSGGRGHSHYTWSALLGCLSTAPPPSLPLDHV